MKIKELLQKLRSQTPRASRHRGPSQASSRERVKSYGSVSGSGDRVSRRSQDLNDRIEKTLS